MVVVRECWARFVSCGDVQFSSVQFSSGGGLDALKAATNAACLLPLAMLLLLPSALANESPLRWMSNSG